MKKLLRERERKMEAECGYIYKKFKQDRKADEFMRDYLRAMRAQLKARYYLQKLDEAQFCYDNLI